MSLKYESEAPGTLSGKSLYIIYGRLFLKCTLELLGVLLSCLGFSTGSQYIAVASLEFCVEQAGLKLMRSACLYLGRAGFEGMPHYSYLEIRSHTPGLPQTYCEDES